MWASFVRVSSWVFVHVDVRHEGLLTDSKVSTSHNVTFDLLSERPTSLRSTSKALYFRVTHSFCELEGYDETANVGPFMQNTARVPQRCVNGNFSSTTCTIEHHRRHDQPSPHSWRYLRQHRGRRFSCQGNRRKRALVIVSRHYWPSDQTILPSVEQVVVGPRQVAEVEREGTVDERKVEDPAMTSATET